MEFGEKIKELRTTNQMTQEKFALRLNVTRQAVSNWENNRNLPDLEMLILISTIFHISLDELILGGSTVNNMTEKLIKDGSETRRAKFNMITTLIGALFLFLGAVCFFIKAHSVEYIDSSGILHENFYLLPIGFFFIFIGIIIFLTTGITFVSAYIKSRR
jgi:transcriptional regulator with XRE-family HTH domain